MESTADWTPRFALIGDMGTTNDRSLKRLIDDVSHDLYDAVIHVGKKIAQHQVHEVALCVICRASPLLAPSVEGVLTGIQYFRCAAKNGQMYVITLVSSQRAPFPSKMSQPCCFVNGVHNGSSECTQRNPLWQDA